jgi:hypothetical protein
MYHGFTIGHGKKSIARIVNKNKKEKTGKGKDKDKDENMLDIIASDNKDELQMEVKLTDKNLELEPLMVRQGDNQMPNRVFIAGQSLCGKTYSAMRLAKDYNKIFPKNKVAVISWVEDDASLNKKKVKNFVKINIDENILSDPLTLEEFHDKLVIFDDIDAYPDKNVVESLCRFRNSCINAGRHQQIDTICTRQNLLDAHKTRDILNGVFQIMFFPHSASRYQARQWMERYLFLPKKTIDRILNLPSRWVLINTCHPIYCLHQKGAFMLTNGD